MRKLTFAEFLALVSTFISGLALLIFFVFGGFLLPMGLSIVALWFGLAGARLQGKI